MMILQAAIFVVAVALTTAVDPVEDPYNALKVKQFPPGHDNNDGDTMKVRCSINVTRADFASLNKLKFYTSSTGGEESSYESLGSLTDSKVSYGLTRKEISVWGKYRLESEDYRSKLDITWTDEDASYCTYYKCVATGREPVKNKLLAIYKILWIGAKDGGSC